DLEGVDPRLIDRRLGADELAACLVLLQHVAGQRARPGAAIEPRLQRAVEQQRLVRRQVQLALKAAGLHPLAEQEQLASPSVVVFASEALLAEEVRQALAAEALERASERAHVGDGAHAHGEAIGREVPALELVAVPLRPEN